MFEWMIFNWYREFAILFLSLTSFEALRKHWELKAVLCLISLKGFVSFGAPCDQGDFIVQKR